MPPSFPARAPSAPLATSPSSPLSSPSRAGRELRGEGTQSSGPRGESLPSFGS